PAVGEHTYWRDEERTMQRSWKQIGMVALACLLLGALGAKAGPDDNRTFVAHLSNDENVPPNDSPAQGQAIFHLSKDGSVMSYKIIVANIENPTASHIHLAPPGSNGAILVGLFSAPAGGGRTDGVLAEGTFPVTSALLAAIQAGNTYVNVHTN